LDDVKTMSPTIFTSWLLDGRDARISFDHRILLRIIEKNSGLEGCTGTTANGAVQEIVPLVTFMSPHQKKLMRHHDA
jgi:hypothetical protein